MTYSLLLLSLLLLARIACGQPAPLAPRTLPLDSLTHHITYSGIIAVPGVPQAELYTRGKIWFAQALQWSHSVLLVDDQAAGLLVGRQFNRDTLMVAFLATAGYLQYTIRLSCKDGNYRYLLTDFHFENGYPTSQAAWAQPETAAEPECFAQRSDGRPTPQAIQRARTLAQEAQRLIANLRTGMRQDAAGGAW